LAKLHRGGKRLIQLRQLANPCKYPRQKIAITAYLQISYFNKNAPEIVALRHSVHAHRTVFAGTPIRFVKPVDVHQVRQGSESHLRRLFRQRC
jgi:hypothetical protein